MVRRSASARAARASGAAPSKSDGGEAVGAGDVGGVVGGARANRRARALARARDATGRGRRGDGRGGDGAHDDAARGDVRRDEGALRRFNSASGLTPARRDGAKGASRTARRDRARWTSTGTGRGRRRRRRRRRRRSRARRRTRGGRGCRRRRWRRRRPTAPYRMRFRRDGADGDSSETQEVVGDRERGVREETHQRNFGGLHEGVAVAAHGAVHLFQLRRDRSTRGRTAPVCCAKSSLICLTLERGSRSRRGGGAHGGA